MWYLHKILSLVDYLCRITPLGYKVAIKEHPATIGAFSYNKNKSVSYRTSPGDLVIPNYQAKGKLVDVLFERNTKLSDSITYDITAWSLPFVYGLDGYSTENKVNISEYLESKIDNSLDKNAIAYAGDWNHMNDARFLSGLMNNKIKVRYNEKVIKNGEANLPRGSYIIYKGDQIIKNYDEVILSIAEKNKIKLYNGYIPFQKEKIHSAVYSLTDTHPNCEAHKLFSKWLITIE